MVARGEHPSTLLRDAAGSQRSGTQALVRAPRDASVGEMLENGIPPQSIGEAASLRIDAYWKNGEPRLVTPRLYAELGLE